MMQMRMELILGIKPLQLMIEIINFLFQVTNSAGPTVAAWNNYDDADIP